MQKWLLPLSCGVSSFWQMFYYAMTDYGNHAALDQDGYSFFEVEDGLVTFLCRSGSDYATLASKARGLMPPRYEWRRRGL